MVDLRQFFVDFNGFWVFEMFSSEVKVVTVIFYIFLKLPPGKTCIHYWLFGCNPSDDVVNSICNIHLNSCRYEKIL